MTSTPHTRTARVFTFVAVLAVLILTVPGLAYAVNGAMGDGGSSAPPDWLERYAAAHPYGLSTPTVVTTGIRDGRSADTLDAARSAHSTSVSPTTSIRDGRSADTLDAATSAHNTSVVPSSGFDWSDAGIGAALGAGAMIALAFCLAVLLARRRHQTPAI